MGFRRLVRNLRKIDELRACRYKNIANEKTGFGWCKKSGERCAVDFSCKCPYEDEEVA